MDWYRDDARLHREDPVAFVGTLTAASDVVAAADQMRQVLRFAPDERGSSWSEAFRLLVAEADRSGVLVMVNGVVGSNTHRKLDPKEFRGFALADTLAPVVFVNGADTKAAQIFTLAHELVHIWLGESAISDADMARTSTNSIERWCNKVAAEFLLDRMGEITSGRRLAPAALPTARPAASSHRGRDDRSARRRSVSRTIASAT